MASGVLLGSGKDYGDDFAIVSCRRAGKTWNGRSAAGYALAKNIAYLGNGIDVAHFAPQAIDFDRTEKLREVGLQASDFVVGSVGRLVKEKGFMEFFAAAETLTARCPQIKFVVIGPREADQNDALDAGYMDDLQRRGIARFVNWCDDMRSWYAAMDIFVLPSYREGDSARLYGGGGDDASGSSQ